jgi:hypothetical protein
MHPLDDQLDNEIEGCNCLLAFPSLDCAELGREDVCSPGCRVGHMFASRVRDDHRSWLPARSAVRIADSRPGRAGPDRMEVWLAAARLVLARGAPSLLLHR